MYTRNGAHHQLTWGVLGAAMEALISEMGANGYGPASFLIFDGQNQVGEGLIMVSRASG